MPPRHRARAGWWTVFAGETLPQFSAADLKRFEQRGNYAGLCFEFLRRFATDIPADTLRGLIEKYLTDVRRSKHRAAEAAREKSARP